MTEDKKYPKFVVGSFILNNADYKVLVENSHDFRSNESDREFKWMKPKDWLKLDRNLFGQYIYEVIEKMKGIER